MGNFKHVLMWAVMFLIVLLTGLSIFGAFIGAQRAQTLFNSVPLTVYWSVFLLVLLLGFAGFIRLLKVPALLLIHLGCILVLCGGLWGSRSAHDIRTKVMGDDRVYKGQVPVNEMSQENRVLTDIDEEVRELPFTLSLKDFTIEYYQPGKLYAQTRDGELWEFEAISGKEYPIGQTGASFRIVNLFENFKLTVEGEQVKPVDMEGPGSNPAVELVLKGEDGVERTKYVFMLFPGHIREDDKFFFSYNRVIKDYISDLEVIEDEQVAAAKSVEVNHPLHFGGYHFYQSSYKMADDGSYVSIFSVTSDSGLYLVYAGYAMLCIGVFWHLWFKDIGRRTSIGKGAADGN